MRDHEPKQWCVPQIKATQSRCPAAPWLDGDAKQNGRPYRARMVVGSPASPGSHPGLA